MDCLNVKSLSPGALLDFYASGEGGREAIKMKTIAEFNPESKNRAVDIEKQIEQDFEKIQDKHIENLLIYKDGYCIAGFIGDESSVNVPGEYHDLWKDATAAHNHPQGKEGGYSGTFSLADITTFANTDAADFRVSAAEGIYTMKRGANSDVRGFVQRVENDKEQVIKLLDTARMRVARQDAAGQYKTKREAQADNKSAQLQALHEYYQSIAGEYGIEYSFLKNKDATGTMEQIKEGTKRSYDKPPAPKGKGSRTKVKGLFTERGGHHKQWTQYETYGKVYVTDGVNKYHGEEAQTILNKCSRTGTMSTTTFLRWRGKRKSNAKKK